MNSKERTTCTVCQKKRKHKFFRFFGEFNICDTCIKKNKDLKKAIKDHDSIVLLIAKLEQNRGVSAEEYNKLIERQSYFLNIINKEITEKYLNNKVKQKIKKRVKDLTDAEEYELNLTKEKEITKVLDSLSMEDLTECDISLTEAETLEDFSKKIRIKKQKQDLEVPNPKELLNKLSLNIIDQEDAVKTISLAVTKFYCRLLDDKIRKDNILIAGPTGTGKTELVKVLSKEVDVPIVILDISSVTASGYKGESIGSLICERALIAADYDVELAQKSIIFLDEIDKKATIHESEGHGIKTANVQQELLTILQGTTISAGEGQKKRELRTHDMFFIAAGAFSGIENIVNKNQGKIGLNQSEQLNETESVFDKLKVEHLIEYGFLPEFIGRFTSITHTNELSREALLKIMNKKDNSIIEHYTRLFNSCNIQIEFSMDFLNDIVDEIISNKIGARGIDQAFEKYLKQVFFDMYNYVGQSIVINKKGIIRIK